MLEAARWLDSGMLPLAGGMLDQTRSFLTAASFVVAEFQNQKEK